MGCYKYRFFPTSTQKNILQEWMNTSRFVYNKTVHCIQKEHNKINFFSLRNKLVPKKNVISSQQWILNTPKEIRAYSVKEVVTAYKTCFSNLRTKTINKFKIGFRSKRKQNTETITLPKQSIKCAGNEFKVYCRKMKQSLKLNKEFLETVNHDFKILHVKKCDLWYICIPKQYDVSTRITENQSNPKVISIDPGIKTFLTMYDKNGKVIKIGEGDMKNKLIPMCERVDYLKSVLSKSKGIRKRNLSIRISKEMYKLKSYLLEIHNKTSLYLSKNYSLILIPNLGKLKMNGRRNRRTLRNWNHSKFIERLRFQCNKRGSTLKIVTEEYTSKTCGNCGWLNETLKNKNIFKCKKCMLSIDRDTNGARNILLKNLK